MIEPRRARRGAVGAWWPAAALPLLLPVACAAPTPDRTAVARPPVSPAPTPPKIMSATTLAPFRLRGEAEQGGLMRGTAPAGTVSLTLDGRPVRIASDSAFLIAFGRDAGPSAMLVATRGDAPTYLGPLAVAPRAWNIQSIPSLPRGTAPTPAFLARRAPELARIAAARAAGSASEGWRQRFVWPVTGRVSGVFGSQRIYAGEPGAYHGGVDIARPAGTVIVAPADGVVVLAADAPFTLEGNLLMVDHGMGLVSAFLHLSRIDVREGDRVRQGQPLGAIGATGRATGPHLHWGMTLGDVRIDPAEVAGPMAG